MTLDSTLHSLHYTTLRCTNCNHYTTYTTLHDTNYNYNYSYNYLSFSLHYARLYTRLHYSTQHYSILHYSHYTALIARHHNYNCNCTTLITLHTTTAPLHYKYKYSCTTPHCVQQLWLQPLQPLQKTPLQPPFGPSVKSLCHPWFTTTNLSYRFPIFEASATALCGTTGIYVSSQNQPPDVHTFDRQPSELWYPEDRRIPTQMKPVADFVHNLPKAPKATPQQSVQRGVVVEPERFFTISLLNSIP